MVLCDDDLIKPGQIGLYANWTQDQINPNGQVQSQYSPNPNSWTQKAIKVQVDNISMKKPINEKLSFILKFQKKKKIKTQTCRNELGKFRIQSIQKTLEDSLKLDRRFSKSLEDYRLS